MARPDDREMAVIQGGEPRFPQALHHSQYGGIDEAQR